MRGDRRNVGQGSVDNRNDITFKYLKDQFKSTWHKNTFFVVNKGVEVYLKNEIYQVCENLATVEQMCFMKKLFLQMLNADLFTQGHW